MADLTFAIASERPTRSGAVSDALVDAIKSTLVAEGETAKSIAVDVTGKNDKEIKRVMANLSALGRTGRIDARVRTTHVPDKQAVYAWAEPKPKSKPKAKKKNATEPAAPPVAVDPVTEPEPVAAAAE